jgi:5'(3')-deoxyribonucleotidase
MKNLTILVDLDGICTDMVGTLIDTYNTEMAEPGEEVNIADLTDDSMETWTPMGKDLWQFVNRDGWFEHLPPLAGAVEALERLHNAGHRVIICTSPGRNPAAPSDKTRWVRRHMPFLPWGNMIITREKDVCHGDVFIDDSPGKLKKIREAWPSTVLMAIAWPYNAEGPLDVRAEGWEDTESAWRTMLQAIDKIAHGARAEHVG